LKKEKKDKKTKSEKRQKRYMKTDIDKRRKEDQNLEPWTFRQRREHEVKYKQRGQIKSKIIKKEKGE
jgi:hypothetical protein